MDFSTITNNVALMYALLLIIVLLIYIAFFKKPQNRKHPR